MWKGDEGKAGPFEQSCAAPRRSCIHPKRSVVSHSALSGRQESTRRNLHSPCLRPTGATIQRLPRPPPLSHLAQVHRDDLTHAWRRLKGRIDAQGWRQTSSELESRRVGKLGRKSRGKWVAWRAGAARRGVRARAPGQTGRASWRFGSLPAVVDSIFTSNAPSN